MIGGLESNRPSDVLAGLQDVAQIEIAVMQARGAEANETELRAVNGATCIGRCSQPLGERGPFDARRYPRLADGRLAGVNGTDLLRGYIDRYNLVAFLAMQAARTVPTYPMPKTLTFIKMLRSRMS